MQNIQLCSNEHTQTSNNFLKSTRNPQLSISLVLLDLKRLPNMCLLSCRKTHYHNVMNFDIRKDNCFILGRRLLGAAENNLAFIFNWSGFHIHIEQHLLIYGETLANLTHLNHSWFCKNKEIGEGRPQRGVTQLTTYLPSSWIWTALSDLLPKNRIWKGERVALEQPGDKGYCH